jgi:hypothetical protein
VWFADWSVALRKSVRLIFCGLLVFGSLYDLLRSCCTLSLVILGLECDTSVDGNPPLDRGS